MTFGVVVFGDVLDGDELRMVTRQDALDGAALRRLREALPEGWRWTAFEEAGELHVLAVQPKDPPPTVDIHEGIGDTIAEAADKCREELG